jgi:hypothetical protein
MQSVLYLIRFIRHLQAIFDGLVKSPNAALRCILRRCGVRQSTPHSSGFARLACGAFYEAARICHYLDFLLVHQ